MYIYIDLSGTTEKKKTMIVMYTYQNKEYS